MLNQTLILVDENDKFLGYAPREECHLGRGKRHRAFVTLLFDSQNKVILQKRKHKLFDGLWDLTAISHPLHVNGKDEDFQTASDRALKKEMGIGHVQIKEIGAFNYFSRDGENCENEYCAVLVGDYDGDWKPNPDDVYEVKKVKYEAFLEDVPRSPKKYTPWAILASKQLKNFRGKSFRGELTRFLSVFEPYSREYFRQKIRYSSKYSPLISNLYKNLEEFSLGGKRMRAFLVYLGYQVAGGKNVRSILPIALAFELIHSFLLIHDDVIDKSETRRGKATIHKVFESKFGPHYGASQAIILGDVACFEALELINRSTFDDSLKVKCERQLLDVLRETGYGQALDIEYSYRKVNLERIWQVASLKTAKYSFVAPLTLGLIVGRNSKKDQLKAIEEYGVRVGMAFQLQDDILGVFGNEKVLGKSVLSDMREGKNTILIHKTIELARPEDRKSLEKIWGKRDASFMDLNSTRKIIKDSGAYDWCEKEQLRMVNKSKEEIAQITEKRDLRVLFGEIADFVVNREK